MFNIKKFWNGLKIVKKLTLESDDVGELEVDQTTGKLVYHDNDSRSAIVTEDHSATLMNKTIDAEENSISNISNQEISANAGIEESKLDLDFSTADLDQDIQDHITETTGAHAGTAISNTPAGTISSTTVQGAINELDGDIQGHITETTGAHAATAISNTPAGTISSTDVQAAINELDGDVQGHVTASTDVHGIGATASVVGTDTTQTLTNKTITGAVINGTTLLSAFISEETQDNSQSGSNVVLTGITKPIVRLTNSGLVSITGISALEASDHGGVITIVNTTPNEITVLNNAGTAEERILTGIDDDIDLAPDACLLLKYDPISDRYRIVGGAGGANPVIKAVAGENLSAREAVYISVGAADSRNAGEAYKLQADDDNRIEYVGLVKETVTTGQTVKIITSGVVKGFTGLDVGKPVFLAPDTAGGFTQVDSDDPTMYNRWVIRLGIAITANLVLISPDQGASAFFQSETQADITIDNNQSTPQNLTNLVFNGATTDTFLLDYTLLRKTDDNSFAQTGRLRGVYNVEDSEWFMSEDFTGQNAGVTFSITNGGQIQYTSTNISGANYSGVLKYRIAISAGISETSLLIEDGDIITRESGNTVRLPVGQPGQVLSVSPDNILQYSERPNPNHVINGNFDFWQRGASLSAAASVRYLADRFVTSGTGSTVAPSRQEFTLGQTEVPNNPKYFHRSVVVSSTGAGNNVTFQHRLEDVTLLAGKTVTLSFWAKADSNKNMSIELSQSFGSGGSPSGSVNEIGVEKISLTSSWQKITKTISIPSVVGKTLGSNNNNFLQVIFWFDAGSNFNARTDSLGHQSGTFDIAQVKLEEGSVATPFSLAGGTIAGELAACQRYYEKSYGIEVVPGTSSTAGNFQNRMTSTNPIEPITFTVTKRSPPSSIVLYNPVTGTTGQWRNNSAATALAAVPVSIGDRGFTADVSSGTSGNVLIGHWTADAEL